MLGLKKDKSSWLKNKVYLDDMKTNCKVDIGGGIVMDLPHTRGDIKGLENAIKRSKDGTVHLQGQYITVALAQQLVDLGMDINIDLDVHLWEKYAEVDACAIEEEITAVLWEYDIEQIYTLG